MPCLRIATNFDRDILVLPSVDNPSAGYSTGKFAIKSINAHVRNELERHGFESGVRTMRTNYVTDVDGRALKALTETRHVTDVVYYVAYSY